MNKRDIEADKKRNKLCKKLYLRLFGRPFPKGWSIQWHIQGATDFHSQWIMMMADSIKDPWDLATLIHEFQHVNAPDMKHGKEFERQHRTLLKEAKRALSTIKRKAT